MIYKDDFRIRLFRDSVMCGREGAKIAVQFLLNVSSFVVVKMDNKLI